MARVSIIVETPGLVRVGLPIIADASYDIQRELNAAGAWVVEFPAAEELARRIKSRWRISIVEEGRPGYLLRRGIVSNRDYQQMRGGDVLLRCAGFTRLYGVNRTSTHQGLQFDGTQAILTIAEDLTGEPVTAPSVAGVAAMKPEVTFNDTSKLGALLTALEYCRLNIRETFDEDGFELVSRDDCPDSGFRFVSIERAGPELMTAAARGIGIIAGSPKIGYSGQDLANRIIPIGVDADNDPLTLEAATLNDPYPVLSALNPDGTTFWYVEDEEAIYDSELIEAHYVRSDIKNPNDDAASRTQAANALYALGTGRLLQTKSDTIAFTGEIANGRLVDALPGDRVKVEFRGRARSFGGVGTFWDLDMFFLVNKRRDASSSAGVRGVSFTLTAPEVPMAIPSLPDAVPIPPPPRDPPDPPDPTGYDDDPAIDEAPADEAKDPAIEDFPSSPALPPLDLLKPPGSPGPYQPCCADKNNNGPGPGIIPPPFDIGGGIPVPGCTIPWQLAAVQDMRFVTDWGWGSAAPDATNGWLGFDPNRDRAIVVLSSSSGDVNLVITGGTPQLLAAFDSATPANFGGDGHAWWRIYWVDITADAIDMSGTTGPFRQITFFKASEDIWGVDRQFTHDLEYHGSQFGTAIEDASANVATRTDDLAWQFIDSWYRSIDDITFEKTFHHSNPARFNHDHTFVNAQPIPLSPGGGALSGIDWMLVDTAPGVSTVASGQRATAVASSFPGACRILSLVCSLRLRAICKVKLLTRT